MLGSRLQPRISWKCGRALTAGQFRRWRGRRVGNILHDNIFCSRDFTFCLFSTRTTRRNLSLVRTVRIVGVRLDSPWGLRLDYGDGLSLALLGSWSIQSLT